MITGISAITLATHDMARAVHFYRSLGFELLYGSEDTSFTSFRAGPNFLNLIVQPADAGLVMVGSRDFLRRRCRWPLYPARRGWIPAGGAAAQRGMGRALLSHHRPGRPRAEFCVAAPALISRRHFGPQACPKPNLRHFLSPLRIR